MQILVVKTSSMGDVLHTLPALTDAQKVFPGIRFDWVVEDDFRQIPVWHPTVDKVIPVAFRAWRNNPGQWFGREVRAAIRTLRKRHYTHIIDAQGLLKSALITKLARGTRHGYSYDTVRESLAAAAYHHRTSVPRRQHAVKRVRHLFAACLGYSYEDTVPDYGIDKSRLSAIPAAGHPYLIFVHASSWPSKRWPEEFWRQLVDRATAASYRVRLPWGNEREYEQARHILQGRASAEVMPKMELGQLASELAQATAVVSVDTGLAHLAAALGTPNVTIYGATNPELTGTSGERQHHLAARFPCSPCLSQRCTYTEESAVTPACYSTVSPDQVWGTLRPYLAEGKE